MTYQIIDQDPDLLFGINCDQGIAGKCFDVSGNGFDADLVGSPQQGRDRFGSFLSFDGVGDYLDMGSVGSSSSILTFLAIITPSGIAGDDQIISRSEATFSTTEFEFKVDSGVLKLEATNGSSVTTASKGGIVAGQKNFVAGVINGNSLQVFIKGVGGSIATLTGTRSVSTASTKIGKRTYVGSEQYLDGNIYTAAIYNKVKSAAWVKQEWERFLRFQS